MAEENEREDSRRLANKILDRPFGDPDDDLAVLSRQLLRADELIVAQREQNIRLEAAATWISAKDNPPTTGMACLVVWSGYVQRVAYRRMGLGFACVGGFEWRPEGMPDVDAIPDGEVTHYRPWPTFEAQVQAAPEKEE